MRFFDTSLDRETVSHAKRYHAVMVEVFQQPKLEKVESN
jgi:hypothetical protein